MTAVREQIFAKIEELLTGAGIAQEVKRMPSGDPGAYPCLHIFDEGQDPEPSEAGAEQFQMNVGIDGYVEGGDGPAAHAAINQLYAHTIETLFPQPFLDGLVEQIDQGRMTVTVATRADKRRMAFGLDLTITFATKRGEPQQVD